MKKISLSTITKEYEIEDIEKQLVSQYLKINDIDYSNSPFLINYLKEFRPSGKLIDAIRELNHVTLDEIVVDMELLIPMADKKTNGAFFTPSYIVDFIIETISPEENAKVIDLSCGSGAFLLGLIKYYMKRYGKTITSCLEENIYGADILDYNVLRCKLLIILLGLTKNEIINEHNIKVVQADSLKRRWDIQFDAIVGNPPYVKFQDLDDNTRTYLLDNWETTKFGTYNLYFAFFELGLKLLKPDGKLGYITPNNYFTSLAGKCLREFFQRNKYVYKIIDFNSTKVFDVQTYTAITFLNKKMNDVIEYDRIESKETPQTFLNEINSSLNSYTDLSIEKWRLLCEDEKENIFSIENRGSALGELFNICVGVATLKDEIYFITPFSEDESYYFINKNGHDFKIEKEVTRPLVKISDMKYQSDIFNNKKRIIFPYYLDKDKPIVINEDIFQKKYPNCYEYLLSVKNILRERGKGKHKYTPFYSYGRTQGLNKNGIKLLTPTFSQYPRFLLDNDKETLFTNGYGIFFYKNRPCSLFSSNLITLEENIDVLQKILNSFVMHYYVTKTSVSIEGGYPCYQKNFIERFSIPDFTIREISELRKMDNPQDIDDFLIEKYHLNLPSPNLSL